MNIPKNLGTIFSQFVRSKGYNPDDFSGNVRRFISALKYTFFNGNILFSEKEKELEYNTDSGDVKTIFKHIVEADDIVLVRVKRLNQDWELISIRTKKKKLYKTFPATGQTHGFVKKLCME